jgi:hypothetical protein
VSGYDVERTEVTLEERGFTPRTDEGVEGVCGDNSPAFEPSWVGSDTLFSEEVGLEVILVVFVETRIVI